jgi:fructose-1,6-bisphosphatase/inositol monophosphatase family enzyme
VNCELVAEEDTPSRKRFAKSAELVLTLDPIDGTKFYSEGKDGYSLIVMLHNKKRPIYTFNYFPELKWGIKIVHDEVAKLGQKPDFDLEKLPKTIIYSNYGQTDPKNIPDLYTKLSKRGYQFLEGRARRAIIGDNAQLFLGLVDGIYVENDSAVDCLVSLHFALANGYEIYQNIDITKPTHSKLGGDEYKGYYLVVRR